MTSPDRAGLTVGVLHPGQMGAAVAAQVRSRGVPVLWCPTDRSAHTARRAADAVLEPATGLADLLDRADVVLSICPPALAEDVADAVAAHGFQGVYVDANAISPARSGRILTTLAQAGARPVDGAIIGPPPTATETTRLYLAGDPAETTVVAELFTGTSVESVVMTQPAPAASALKMAYAGYQKATRVLAALAHALATHHDVTEHLLSEAHRGMGSALAEPAYLPSVAARAWRWAPEMREIADTLAAAHLPPNVPEAAAEVLQSWQHDKDDWGISPAEVLRHLVQTPLSGFRVAVRPYDHLDSRALVRALFDEQVERYGYADPADADATGYAPPHGLFLVGYIDERPVACGGYQGYNESGAVVEIKKMYTVPELRGRGLGRAIIRELEDRAIAAGARQAILETGVRNTAALALYTAVGYRPRAQYVDGWDPAINRAFAKPLPPA
jgi:3-hydroxyisobutyrate dehydrogenase-like beta-hydroxyacid dehydrogenase/GNAT superfamily N-acetyltransferase